MNIERRYREPSTGKSFGTNAFKMLKYATEHPGCILECLNPVDGSKKQQKFIESSIEEKGENVTVTIYTEMDGGVKESVTCIIPKQHWQ